MWRGMKVSFRDMLFLLVFMYLLIGGIALAHVHKKAEESSGAKQPGNVIIELRWDRTIDADVDLWVQGPGDVPVGYSNKGGAIFNLVRDDLGLRHNVHGEGIVKSIDGDDIGVEFESGVWRFGNKPTRDRFGWWSS